MNVKIILGAILFLFVTTSISSQITVTNASFPALGDTLKTATDNSPQSINIADPGGPFTWDFSMLNADSRSSTIYQSSSDGMASSSYPDAELVVIGDAGEETYYDITATAFSNLGFSGSEFLDGFPLDADLKFIPSLQERRAPLEYPSVANTSSALSLAIPTSALPGEILDSLGIPSELVDSIRVKLTLTRSDFVDAFGTLLIPGGTYEVLREKRIEYSDTRLEIHIPFLGWQDITDLLPIDGFGQDTTISYLFLSNTEKEAIAIVTMDTTGLIAASVEFKDNGVTSAVEEVNPELKDFLVYPNPVFDILKISFINDNLNQYTIRLYNSHGALVKIQDVTSGFEQIVMNEYSDGLYTYQVVDNRGQSVGSGKLVKIK